VKHLSYIQDARCLNVNIKLRILGYYNNAVCMHVTIKDNIRRNVGIIVISEILVISAIVLKPNFYSVD